MSRKDLYIVYCIDAEGPLYEPLDATFERVRQIFGVEMEVSHDKLIKLQQGNIQGVSGEKRDAIMKMIAPDRLAFNSDWSTLNKAIEKAMSSKVRNSLPDSY